jgi:hypothetical protein
MEMKMKNYRLEILYAGIYILLFIILFNLTIDNPFLELFRRYYWIIVSVLSFIYPVIKLNKVKFKDIILNYAFLLALTFLTQWTGDAVYYFFVSSANATVLYFIIFSKLSFASLTVSYITGILIKIILIILINQKARRTG